jgi:hypothetical protein
MRVSGVAIVWVHATILAVFCYVIAGIYLQEIECLIRTLPADTYSMGMICGIP